MVGWECPYGGLGRGDKLGGWPPSCPPGCKQSPCLASPPHLTYRSRDIAQKPPSALASPGTVLPSRSVVSPRLTAPAGQPAEATVREPFPAHQLLPFLQVAALVTVTCPCHLLLGFCLGKLLKLRVVQNVAVGQSCYSASHICAVGATLVASRLLGTIQTADMGTRDHRAFYLKGILPVGCACWLLALSHPPAEEPLSALLHRGLENRILPKGIWGWQLFTRCRFIFIRVLL